MRTSLLLALAGSAAAWMPKSRNMTTADGNSLFESKETTYDHVTRRWLPGNLPVRGVNLGSMFVIEPWMAQNEFPSIGCSSAQSEFDCVKDMGQASADQSWPTHWNSFITQGDFDTMASYSLNTIRIPVGYWILEGLKYDSEYFPNGGFQYLQQICSWAADKGFYIIIDLHGAPFAQVGNNADTGQLAQDPSDSNPDFYQSSQYQRGLWFLGNMTQWIHNSSDPNTGAFRNVGMLEIVNEPWTGAPSDLLTSLRQSYYPDAFSTIRAVESSMGISGGSALHIQMMNEKWGVGDPNEYISDLTNAAYDDHRYLKYDPTVTISQQGYLDASCSDDRGGNTPTIVGEWSLSIDNDHQFDSEFWPIENNLQFYQNWFAAQVQTYEKSDVDGWIFWSWVAQLGDPRWSYKDAVAANIIPQDLSTIAGMTPCS